MSKISKIILDNFEAHEHSEIDFAKVNIIIGENGAGKSTIVNGITLGISGTLPTKPYSDYIKTGTDKSSVTMNVGVGEHTRQTRKVISADGKLKTELLSTNNLLQQIGTNPETARTLVDTWYFVESATDVARRNVLSSVLSREYTVEELQNAISAKANNDSLQWHQEFIKGNYDSLSNTKKTQMEVLYKIAYDRRAELKKQIATLNDQLADNKSKLSAYADIPEQVDAEAVARTIEHTQIKTDRDYLEKSINSDQVTLDEYKKKVDNLKNTKAELEKASPESATKEQVEELQGKVSILDNQIISIKSQIDKISASQKDTITCPIYGVECDFDPTEAKDKLEIDHTNKCKTRDELKTTLDKKSEAYGVWTKINEISSLLEGAETKISLMEADLVKKQEDLATKDEKIKELETAGILTKEGLDASKNQTEVTALKSRIAVYEEDLATHNKSLVLLEEAVSLYKDKEIWTSLLSCNKDVFSTKLKEIVELLIPKYTVEIDDNMNLSFCNVSINTLSKSEKFRVGVGIQAALSIAAGIGIVVVDGSDIVTDPTNLIETINKLGVMEEIENLIVTSSYDFTKKDDKRTVKIEVPAIHYIVKDGAVERQPDLFGTESW